MDNRPVMPITPPQPGLNARTTIILAATTVLLAVVAWATAPHDGWAEREVICAALLAILLLAGNRYGWYSYRNKTGPAGFWNLPSLWFLANLAVTGSFPTWLHYRRHGFMVGVTLSFETAFLIYLIIGGLLAVIRRRKQAY